VGGEGGGGDRHLSPKGFPTGIATSSGPVVYSDNMPTGTRPEPPVDTVRVAISGDVFTHPFTNVFWLRFTRAGAAVVNDLNTIIDGMLTAYDTNLVAKLGANVSGVTADASWITAVGTDLNTIRSHTVTPSGNPSVEDASACAVMSSVISARYRGGHPRTYLPGPQAAHIANGSTLDGTILPGFITSAAAFRNAVNALTAGAVTAVELGTVSFVRSGAWRVPPVFEPFTGSTIRATLGSQRRRITA
jgi:hypothetical protein